MSLDATAGVNDNLFTFSMGLTKHEGRSLGIDVVYRHVTDWSRRCLFITGVRDGGLVAAENLERQERYRVRVGDFICQVNDVQDDIAMMIQEMKVSQELTLHFMRKSSDSNQCVSSYALDTNDAGIVLADRSLQEASEPPPATADAIYAHLTRLDDSAFATAICFLLRQRPWLQSGVFDDRPILCNSRPLAGEKCLGDPPPGLNMSNYHHGSVGSAAVAKQSSPPAMAPLTQPSLSTSSPLQEAGIPEQPWMQIQSRNGAPWNESFPNAWSRP